MLPLGFVCMHSTHLGGLGSISVAQDVDLLASLYLAAAERLVRQKTFPLDASFFRGRLASDSPTLAAFREATLPCPTWPRIARGRIA
jgi:hypothetical protein